MKRLRAMASFLRMGLLAVLTVLPGISPAHAEPSPDYADLRFARTPQKTLTLDLYLPENTPNPPLLVYIHGGGWRGGNPKNVPFAYLTKEGIAVASITYRLSQEAKFPAQLDDVKAALAWLRAKASDYGVDASRMALVGASAGAHLAMLAGLTADEATGPVRAIVSYFGPSDFLLRSQTQPKSAEPGSTVYDLLGGPAPANEDLAKAASPAFQVTASAPPLLLFHGSKDTTVLPDQSARMVDAYRAAGRPVELRMKDGAVHRLSDFEDPASRAALLAFLREHLKPAQAALALAPVFTVNATPGLPDHITMRSGKNNLRHPDLWGKVVSRFWIGWP